MIEFKEVTHHIQKYILSKLMHVEYARFRDLRPPRTDTNLYSYHLKQLLASGLVDKDTRGYYLSATGGIYVDRVNAETTKLTMQPKIITMLVLQNEDGKLAVYEKIRQPFIGNMTIPFGKVHISDESIEVAAHRELREKVTDASVTLRHVGDAYIRILHDADIGIVTLAHVFYGEIPDSVVIANERVAWLSPYDVATHDAMAPAVKDIVARTFFHDPYFFEEFSIKIQ